MFTAEKNILLVTPTKIRAGKVILDKTPKVKGMIEFEWNWENLVKVLIEVKKVLGDNFRVGVDDNLVYVTSFLIPNTPGKEREVVGEYAAGIIPEDIKNIIWDFREISPHSVEVPSGQKLVQFVGGAHSFLLRFTQSLEKANVRYESIEPTSFAQARLLSETEGASILANIENSVMLICIVDGYVISTETVSQLSKKALDQFIAFNLDKIHATPTQLFVTGNTANLDLGTYQSEKMRVSVLQAEPMIGLALKTDIRGNDNQVLNLDLLSQKGKIVYPIPAAQSSQTASTSAAPTKAQQKKMNPLLMVLLFFLWSVSIVGIGLITKVLLPQLGIH